MKRSIVTASPSLPNTAAGTSGPTATRPLDISIVVPTRNESGNVAPLLQRIERATEGLHCEVIFVDDSSDDTPEVVQQVGSEARVEVTLIARPPERRNGLGKAVVEGIRVARADWVCVMDGDLQHPPEVIPQLFDHARASGSTLVAASRLTKGGSTDGLSFRRKLVSYGLALANRVVFPKRLRQISDPLTGFFLVRRDTLDPDQLQPEGFKILLEILVRSQELRASEVPFVFAERHSGESKANTAEAMLLFRQMLRLYLQAKQHLLRFVVVGVTGLVINNGLLAVLVEMFGVHYLVAAILATQGSTGWNFGWTERWVFHDRPQAKGLLWRRLSTYFVMNNAMLVLRGPLLALFVSVFGMHYLVGNILSLAVMTIVRFMISDSLIWTRKGHVTDVESAPATATIYAMTQPILQEKE